MRLIDADKLPYVNKVILVDKSDGDVIITIAKEYTSYVNDETPTVKAIPIEWIKKWCLEHYPTYPRIITEQLLKKTETWRMIDDWEKENA